MRTYTKLKCLDGSMPDAAFQQLVLSIQRKGLGSVPHLRPHAWLLLLGCCHPQHDESVQAARAEDAKHLYTKYHSLAKQADTAASVYAVTVSTHVCTGQSHFLRNNMT